jgi:hypothetical protein
MGSDCIDPRILDLGTSWRWVVSFTPRPLYLRRKSPGTHWVGGWVGPGTGLDGVERRKILPLPGLELRPLGRLARGQLLYRLRYPGYLYPLYEHLLTSAVLWMNYGHSFVRVKFSCIFGHHVNEPTCPMRKWDRWHSIFSAIFTVWMLAFTWVYFVINKTVKRHGV